jgi:hypothetical protein
MNDPHVESLQYRLCDSETTVFANPPDVPFENAEFRGVLSNGVLNLTPKEHYASEFEIRPLAEAFVRAWEVSAGVMLGVQDFRFRYGGAAVIDRAPAPGFRNVSVSDTILVSDSVEYTVQKSAYPPAPGQFVVTPEVEALWERYCNYKAGREFQLSMAYACLTLLERPNRPSAAENLDIDVAVLNKLGELSSTRGDLRTGRKLKAGITPLSGREQEWIDAATKAIIFHLAIRVPGRKLSMTDLPAL